VLTVLNAVIGLRQEGKAESAMNALTSSLQIDESALLILREAGKAGVRRADSHQQQSAAARPTYDAVGHSRSQGIPPHAVDPETSGAPPPSFGVCVPTHWENACA
jgi:hypothetical protein